MYKTKEKFEDLRRKRNKYTHGVHRQTIGPEYVIDVIYLFLNDLWGEDWIDSFKEVMLSEAIYGFSNIDEENVQLSAYFKFFEKYLTKKKIPFFNWNATRRKKVSLPILLLP